MIEGGVSKDVDSRSGLPSRRWSGILLLAIAAFAVFVIPRVLSPGIAGSPSGLPFPDPPPVGACVLVDPDAVVQVPCSQEHDGEVAKSWPAGELPAPTFVLNRNYSMLATDDDGALLTSDALCSGWGSQYVGTLKKFGPALWSPAEPSYFTVTVGAPPGSGTESHHWVACVVFPGEQSKYLGSVHDSGGATGNTRPDVFGWCFPTTSGATPAVYVSCAEPHRLEQLATFIPTQQMFYANTITVETTMTEIDSRCRQLATQMIGAADPTFGGQLEIVAAAVSDLQDVGEGMESVVRSGLLIPDCVVRYLGAGQLTGTVVGLGEHPLPLG